MVNDLGFGWVDMAKDGDEALPVTEPEIIRTLAVGAWVVRLDKGQIYIEAHERLPGEARIGARLSVSPEGARELVTMLTPLLKRRH